MTRPVSVSHAVQVIWATNVASALLLAINFDGSDSGVDSLVFNGLMLLLYVWVTVRIGQGRQWARLSYAGLVALECAIVAAFGLEQATELEALITYLTLPLELWALYKLFGADADAWFKPEKSEVI